MRAVVLSLTLASCGAVCDSVDDFVFEPVTPNVVVGESPTQVEFIFYPSRAAEISFPEDILSAVQIKDGDRGLGTVERESNLVRRTYSKSNPLRIVIEASRITSTDGDYIQTNIGNYNGRFNSFSIVLYRTDRCLLDDDHYFISDRVSLAMQD